MDTTTPEGRADLSIEIAKRLGWRIEPTNLALFAERSDVWDVIPPLDGERMTISKTMLITELDAWRYCFKQPQLYGLGDWPNDLNAALNLLLTSGAVWSMSGGGAKISRVRMYNGELNDVREYGDTDKLALLICKAWLAFDDQRVRRIGAST